jgi:hypothetical protein
MIVANTRFVDVDACSKHKNWLMVRPPLYKIQPHFSRLDVQIIQCLWEDMMGRNGLIVSA